MKKIGMFLMLAIVIGLLGCASKSLNIVNTPPNLSECKVMGNAEGSSGGLLFWGIIPLGVNGRFKNAYEEPCIRVEEHT